MSLADSHSPARIFLFSLVGTIAILVAVLLGLGWSALVTTLILLVIEVTFSFENAIINAKILASMSKFWQNMFLSVGIIIAIFGMRIVFPIVIVAVSTGMPWKTVIDLALNDPTAYAEALSTAHPTIAAFGGAFLMMLATSYFFDSKRSLHWIQKPEQFMQKYGLRWVPATITAAILGIVAILSHHPQTIITAGAVGVVTYMAIHGLAEFFGSLQPNKPRQSTIKRTGIAAFMSFLYLEILDASFSLDGVIGAFAITNLIILIAAGLGAGALWVRSLTVYIVRKGTLHKYRYIEHGAHYTVLILAFVMFFSELLNIPEAIAGIAGVLIIISSIASSRPKVHHAK